MNATSIPLYLSAKACRALVVITAAVLLTLPSPAHANPVGRGTGVILKPGGIPRPTQPVQGQKIPDLVINPGPAVEPMGALGDLSKMDVIDRPGTYTWTASRSGTMWVKAGETFSLYYLSRGKPSYNRVALLFTENTNGLHFGKNCPDLSGAADRITSIEGQLSVEPANAKVVAAAKEQGMDPHGQPLYLVQVVAAYNGDLATAAALKKKAAVRAFPLGPGSKCLKKSNAAYLATLSNQQNGPIVIANPAPPSPPSVGLRVAPVGWAPMIEHKNCSYIIYAGVSDPAWEEVLKLRNISRSVGTRFTMCQSEFTTAYNNLSDWVKAKIAIKNALGAFTSAFNWTAGKFQSVASTLASPLKGLLPPSLGGNFLDAAADMFVQGLMGQLPGSPLTGDVAMVANQGCGWVKAQLGGAAAAQKPDKQLTEDEKAKTDNAVQQLCNAIQAAMMENAKANDFLQFDLTREPRKAIMYVRVSYMGMNGAKNGMMSQASARTLTVRSHGGEGPYAQGNGNFPQVLLMTRDVVLPPGAAGTSAIYPFSMDYAMDPKSMAFTVGATAYAGMRASAGGYPGDDLQMKGLLDTIPAPPK